MTGGVGGGGSKPTFARYSPRGGEGTVAASAAAAATAAANATAAAAGRCVEETSSLSAEPPEAMAVACGWCRKEVEQGGEGVLVWCSWECRQQLLLRSSGEIRRQLFALELGVCAVCSRDAHRLYLTLRALQPAERMQLLMREDFPWTRRVLDAPNEGDCWQADHTLPVAEGGGCCGMDNFRTLCTPCHRVETEKGRLRLKERKRKAAAQGAPDIRSLFGHAGSGGKASSGGKRAAIAGGSEGGDGDAGRVFIYLTTDNSHALGG
mmetsp:Transcript_26716/g.65983  ORF Transcript_26716/g.65983 Transcript_26716/m.65983 type:complete len:265 (+) Transcript_26716:2-796(+)